MIYYQDEAITIRDLCEADAETIAREEVLQGWLGASPEKYRMRLRDRDAGKAIALAADFHGNVAGYINVYPDAQTGAFGGKGFRRSLILACWKNSANAESAPG